MRWLQQRGHVVMGSAGVVERMVGVTLDITGQRRAEQRLADTFEHISDGFLALDSGGVVTYANTNAARLLGCSSQALLARSLEVVGAEFARACQQVLRSGYNDCAEYRFGSLGRWLEARIFGDPEGLSVYLRDVSVQHADEEARLAAVAQQAARAERAERLVEVSAALERLREVERREHAFVDIAATFAGADSLERTLDATARVVVEAAGVGACSIILFEGEPVCGRVAGSFGLPDYYRPEFAAAVRSGRHLPSLEAFQTQRAVLVADIRTDPALEGLIVQAWHSEVCLPLIVRGTPLGTLKVLYPDGHRTPDDAEVAFLQAVADQTAIAVDRARLYAEASGGASMRERRRLAQELHDSVTQLLFSMTLLAGASSLKLQRLHDLTRVVGDGASLDELLAVLLPRIHRTLGVDAVRVFLLDEATQELVRVGSAGLKTSVGVPVRVPVGTGFAGRVAADRQPLVVGDASQTEEERSGRLTRAGSTVWQEFRCWTPGSCSACW